MAKVKTDEERRREWKVGLVMTGVLVAGYGAYSFFGGPERVERLDRPAEAGRPINVRPGVDAATIRTEFSHAWFDFEQCVAGWTDTVTAAATEEAMLAAQCECAASAEDVMLRNYDLNALGAATPLHDERGRLAGAVVGHCDNGWLLGERGAFLLP